MVPERARVRQAALPVGVARIGLTTLIKQSPQAVEGAVGGGLFALACTKVEDAEEERVAYGEGCLSQNVYGECNVASKARWSHCCLLYTSDAADE